MVGCIEDFMVTWEDRPHDTNKEARTVIIPGVKEGHVYYGSDQWIRNVENSPIPTFEGQPPLAPEGFYGLATYKIDVEVMRWVGAFS